MDRLPRVSPAAYRWVTGASLVLLAGIIVSGGAVRVTGSGLGCPDWPQCSPGQLAPAVFTAGQHHATIEFVNRTITGLVSLVVIVAVLTSLLRAPRRRDLTLLSLGLVGGVVGQIVLGGVTVLVDLDPRFVMAHFLLSLVIVVDAVVLHWRAGRPDTVPRPVVPARARAFSRALLVVLGLAIVAGCTLTGTGPHAGDDRVRRYGLNPPTVARVHGVLVEVFTVGLLVLLVVLWRRGVPQAVLRRGSVVIAVAIAQSAVGYVQYFNGIPAVLVGVHIAGATCVWMAFLWFHLGLWERSGPQELVAPRTSATASIRQPAALAS